MDKFICLQKLLILFDPWQLINMDCPFDEYDFEINNIIKSTMTINIHDKKALMSLIESEFKVYENMGLVQYSSRRYRILTEVFITIINNDFSELEDYIHKLIIIWDPVGLTNLKFEITGYGYIERKIYKQLKHRRKITGSFVYKMLKNTYREQVEITYNICDVFADLLNVSLRY